MALFRMITRDPGPAPDGGVTAWLQVVAGCLTTSLTWGYSSSFGVYQLYYTENRPFSPSQVSWIGSSQVFLTFFVGVLSGRLADAGFAQQTVLAGSFLAVFGTFMTSLTTAYWQIFLAQAICTGLGMGLMFMPSVVVISSYFREKRGLALTTSGSGAGLGSIVFPLVVQYLQAKIGFLWAVRVQAFIVLLISIVIMLLLRPRLPPRKSGPIIEAQAFLEASYSLFTVGIIFAFWALFFAVFYINSYATSVVGVSAETGANLLVIINAMTIPARPLVGYLSDRWFNPLLTMAASCLFLSCMLLTWIPVKSIGSMYAWTVFYGLAVGGMQGMFNAALASLTRDPAKMGTRYGMVLSICAFATLAGPPTAGAIIESMDGKFFGAQVWAGVVTAIGSLFCVAAMWLDRETYRPREKSTSSCTNPAALGGA